MTEEKEKTDPRDDCQHIGTPRPLENDPTSYAFVCARCHELILDEPVNE